jgi:hypothetical protein
MDKSPGQNLSHPTPHEQGQCQLVDQRLIVSISLQDHKHQEGQELAIYITTTSTKGSG